MSLDKAIAEVKALREMDREAERAKFIREELGKAAFQEYKRKELPEEASDWEDFRGSNLANSWMLVADAVLKRWHELAND